MEDGRIGVLFICLGNICRSPLAEGVFRGLVRSAGLEHRFHIDSAGTSNYHEGDPPDERTVAIARHRGIELERTARRVSEHDLTAFDYLIAMDASNLREVKKLASKVRPDAEVVLLRPFDPEYGVDADVPDPYFGGREGFVRVQEIIERACAGLLDYIREAEGL